MYQCFCTHCGTRLTPQARFCQGCAAAVNLPTAPTAEAPAPTPAPKTAAPTKDKTKPKGRKFSAGVLFLSLMLGFSLALTLLLGEIRVMSTVELPQQTVDFLLEQVDLTQEDLAVLTGQLEQLGIGEILLSDEVLMALAGVMALTVAAILLLRRLRLFYALEDVSIPLMAAGGWFSFYLLLASGLGFGAMYLLGSDQWQTFGVMMGNLLVMPLSVLGGGIVLGILGYLGDRFQRQ